MGYYTTNPCFCGGSSTPTTPTSNCPGGQGDCFCFCDIFIGPLDDLAVPPCGQVGTIDVLDFTNDTSTCGTTTVAFDIANFDADFFGDGSVTIDQTGRLNWTIDPLSTKFSGNIEVKAYCGVRGTFFNVTIVAADLCSTVTCLPGFDCDRCDGTCIEAVAPTGTIINVSETTVIAQGSEEVWVLPKGALLDKIIVESAAAQTVTVGTTTGGDDIINETLGVGEIFIDDNLIFNASNEVPLYVNADDAKLTFYFR